MGGCNKDDEATDAVTSLPSEDSFRLYLNHEHTLQHGDNFIILCNIFGDLCRSIDYCCTSIIPQQQQNNFLQRLSWKLKTCRYTNISIMYPNAVVVRSLPFCHWVLLCEGVYPQLYFAHSYQPLPIHKKWEYIKQKGENRPPSAEFGNVHWP